MPYLAVAIFAGLRPFELRRLTWDQVLLHDGEIRVDGSMSKTGTPRTIHIHPTLKRWLEPYQGRPFFPKNWRRQFTELVRTIGFGSRRDRDTEASDDGPKLRRWVPDILRHTCASHMFRLTGRYGEVAEALGNSESIIRRHYAGRVSSEDTRTFWAITPRKRSGVNESHHQESVLLATVGACSRS